MDTAADRTHQEIVDALIDAALEGDAPWQKPWTGAGSILPANAITGRTYSGSNLLWLWMMQQQMGTMDGRWLTPRQAEQAGYTVKAGAQTQPIIVLSTFVPKEERRRAEQEDRKPRQARYTSVARVVHASDVLGLPAPALPESRFAADEVPEVIERLIRHVDAQVIHSVGDEAFHMPAANLIVLPVREQFGTIDGYVSTVLHEVAHWTGGEARLNRTRGGAFGTMPYAREELVAEIAAAVAASRLGTPSTPADSAAYLRSWVQRADADERRRMLVKATKHALAAADMIVDVAARPVLAHAAA